MKKILLIALMAFAGAGVYAQGNITFSTLGATVQPTVITTETGAPAGAGYMAALYFAPSGVTDASMFMQAGPSANFVASTGLLSAGTRTAPTEAPGGDGNFQIRAWATAFGATYEEAVAAGGVAGESAIIPSGTALTTGTPPPTPTSLVAAANAAGLPLGFQMTSVPEPSVIALGLLGAGALLALRRRK
jgi:MYXO-CTERM domain-containing protein